MHLTSKSELCLSSAVRASSPLSSRAKPIESIAVGDWVWAWDDAVGARVKGRVVRLFRSSRGPIVTLTCIREKTIPETIQATSEHPFWVLDRGWIAAGDLRSGDSLPTLTGSTLTVRRTRNRGRCRTVFNFEVEAHHSYFVGRSGVLVHNSSEPPGADAKKPQYGPTRAHNYVPAFPGTSSTTFMDLAESIDTQFGRTGSFAILDTSRLFTSDFGSHLIRNWRGDGTVFNQRINRNTSPRIYTLVDDSYATPSRTRPMAGYQTALLEHVRSWTEQLLSYSFGPDVVRHTTLEGRHTTGTVKEQLWHADGSLTFAAVVTTNGPGTEVLKKQFLFPRDTRLYTSGWSDSEAGVKGPEDYIKVPRGHMLVLAGQGLFEFPRDVGYVPTAHRVPASDSERFVLLVRGYSYRPRF